MTIRELGQLAGGALTPQSLAQIEDLRQDAGRQCASLDSAIQRMHGLAAAPGGGSAARLAQTSRWRDISAQLTRDLRSTLANLEAARSRSQLLGAPRLDLEGGTSTETNQLLRERTAWVSSMSVVEEAIHQARGAGETLREQTRQMEGVGGKLTSMAASVVPGVHSLISRIHQRQFRENLIVGATIAACTCFLIWYRVLSYLG